MRDAVSRGQAALFRGARRGAPKFKLPLFWEAVVNLEEKLHLTAHSSSRSRALPRFLRHGEREGTPLGERQWRVPPAPEPEEEALLTPPRGANATVH